MTVAQTLNLPENYVTNEPIDLGEDRIFVIRPIPGLPPKSSGGMVDNNLFTGVNKLHAVYEGNTGLWSLRYELGKLPEPFQQKFTSFRVLKEFVDGYYRRRNVEIFEIKRAK